MKSESENARRLQDRVNLEKVFAHPPERVWQALTDPKALAQWLLPTTFQPKLGHRFRFTRVAENGKRQKVRCQIVELDAPRHLAYTWQAEGEDAPALVTWTLEAIAEGTRLRLEHTGLQTSCAYHAKSVSFPADRFVAAFAAFLQNGGLQASRCAAQRSPLTTRVGRIVLPATSRPLRCVRSRIMPENKFAGTEEVLKCSR